jgi:ELWxxDGT repeat protein
LGGHYFISTSRSPSGGKGGPLLATDGTATGTRKVHDFPLTTPQPFRNGVIFIARDDDSNAGVPWFSDGTVAGTRMLPKRGETNDRPYRLFVTGDQAWYARGSRLWRTDGTEVGTIEMPVHPSRTGDVVSIVRIGTRTWFIEAWTGDDPGPSKLWCSDDSNVGMHVVQTFDYSIQLPRPTHLGGVGNVALFFYRRQLYRSDGTVSGTYELPVIADVYDCAPGFRAFGKSVVFAGAPNGGGYVLWRTDGTVAGTLVLFESTNQHFACGQEPAVAGDLVYFPGTDGSHGEEPWVSDGTTGGTHMVDDVAPLYAGSYPREFTVAGTRVFFTAYLPGYRRELWAIGPDVPPAKRHSARH